MIQKSIKKLLACIMVVLVLMGSLPMAVVSAETLVTDDGFEYEIKNEAVTITGYTGDATELVIPEEIEGLAVTAIGNRAFEKKTELIGVSLPSTLVTLSDNAFGGCTALTSVVIPDSVTTIGGYVFENCESLKDVVLSKSLKKLGNRVFKGTAIESIEIPRSLDEADYYIAKENYNMDGKTYSVTQGPFALCENLKTVTFEEGTTQIARNLFAGAVGLEEIAIPDTVTVIEESSFDSCVRLDNVVIPDSVTTIGGRAFENCASLKDVVLSKSLKELGNRVFKGTAIESIEIPRSLDEADYYIAKENYNMDGKTYSVTQGPFALCENLKTVTFQKGTTQIARNLFAGAVGLEEIVIPDTVTVIEESAFDSCVRLDNVVIPDSVTTIGGRAFENCASLKDVVLSKSLKELGNRVFKETAIESIEIPRSLDEADYYIANVNYNMDGKTYSVSQGPFALCENLKTVTFEEGTTQIAEYLFAGAVGLEEIVIPDTVTVIENSAFDSCVRLTDVTIPDTVTEIGNKVFNTCISMTEIVVPDSVTKINSGAFSNCIALSDITLPQALSVLSDKMFTNCTALETITLPETLTKIENDVFSGCSSLIEFTVPENVEEIGSGVFQNCVSLETVTIPQSTKKLGNSAFAGCEALTTVDIADYSITSIGSDTFKACFELKEIQLPKGLTTINNQAFVNCVSLYDVIIPESVTSINKSALSYPSKTTIYSQTGSYVEEFANEGGFTFVDNVTEADTITLANADKVINLKLGEKFRVKFNANPTEANEVITLAGSNSFVDIQGHDIKTSYWSGTTVITATTGSGATYEFTVNVRKVDKIEIVAEPVKTVYKVGEELDLTGLLVQSQYNDEYTEEITDYTVTGFDSSKKGKALVTVGWTDLTGTTHTETFEIEIVDPNAFELGDVNLDGSINIKDATQIQKHLASLVTLEGEAISLADYDGDAKITIKDATAIQKKIAGII